MTATTGQANTITNIADRAMLVHVNIRLFNVVKTDKKITAEVAQAHGSDVTMGRYAKSIVGKSAFDVPRKLAAEIREEHYRRTLPWSEDGARILTSSGYFEYAEWMRGAESKWAAAVNDACDSWPGLVEDARVRLNGLYDPADYPSLSELRGKFEFRWSVRPVPAAEDFRVSLGASEVAAIRADLQASLETTVSQAMTDVWSRMREVVGKMAERLRAYDPNNPGTAPFRDSLVTNITDLLDILPSLNLTGSPEIQAFSNAMRESLTHYDAQSLRDNMYAREDTAKRAEAILAQMSAFVA